MAAPAPQAPIVNLNMVLDQVAKDKGIERSVLVDTLQNAIAQAAKKHFGQDRAIEATYNEEKQVVEVFQTLTVVERVEVEDPVKAVNQISLASGSQARPWVLANLGVRADFRPFRSTMPIKPASSAGARCSTKAIRSPRGENRGWLIQPSVS